MNMQTWNQAIRRAFKASGMSMYKLAQVTALRYSKVQHFLGNDDTDCTLATAETIGRALGLELRTARPAGRKGR